MENINLDEYYVSIEHLDNLPDANIEQWIESGNSEKITNKLKKLGKVGGSFSANGFQATSTDPVLMPFLFHKGKKWTIEFTEARHIHFFPAIDIPLNDSLKAEITSTSNNVEKSEPVVPPVAKPKKVTKRKMASEVKEGQIKKELLSPVKKKQKIAERTETHPQVDLDQSMVDKSITIKEEKIDNKSIPVTVDKAKESLETAPENTTNGIDIVKQEKSISAENGEKTKKKKKKSKKHEIDKNPASELENSIKIEKSENQPIPIDNSVDLDYQPNIEKPIKIKHEEINTNESQHVNGSDKTPEKNQSSQVNEPLKQEKSVTNENGEKPRKKHKKSKKENGNIENGKKINNVESQQVKEEKIDEVKQELNGNDVPKKAKKHKRSHDDNSIEVEKKKKKSKKSIEKLE